MRSQVNLYVLLPYKFKSETFRSGSFAQGMDTWFPQNWNTKISLFQPRISANKNFIQAQFALVHVVSVRFQIQGGRPHAWTFIASDTQEPAWSSGGPSDGRTRLTACSSAARTGTWLSSRQSSGSRGVAPSPSARTLASRTSCPERKTQWRSWLFHFSLKAERKIP